MKLQSIFDQTDFVHASGTKEELQVANYLKEQCETLGVPAELESFRVAMGEIEEAHLYADGMGIPCKALTCCGSGSVEVIPIRSASSPERIFFLASSTSKLTIIISPS